MFKKTITYTDFDDNQRTESYYFHMNKAEAYDWLLGLPAETRAKMQAAVEEQNTSLTESEVLAMMHYIRDLILTSVGEKSEDGRRFIKTDDYSKEFSQTEAFAQIYSELMENSDEASAFINGVMPKDLVEAAEKANKNVTALPKAKMAKGPALTAK